MIAIYLIFKEDGSCSVGVVSPEAQAWSEAPGNHERLGAAMRKYAIGWRAPRWSEQATVEADRLSGFLGDPEVQVLACRSRGGRLEPFDSAPGMSVDADCAGPGQCHGPMKWCATCGDVAYVCTEPGVCSCHPDRDELAAAERELAEITGDRDRAAKDLRELDAERNDAQARVDRLKACKG